MPASAEVPRRLGRPPASSSVETRQRILDVARQAFAEQGWETTTNHDVAEKAGVTSAALYHYFDSKLDMYLAVHDAAQEVVGREFATAAATSDSFVGQFAAMLETAYRLNEHDPSLARFLGSSRVDVTRHPELEKAIRRRRQVGDELVVGLIDIGVATGEIAPSRRGEIASLARVILVGLNDAVSNDLTRQREAIDGIRALLEGRLIEPDRSRRESIGGEVGRHHAH
jgi:AcrR family transcriptional regulator